MLDLDGYGRLLAAEGMADDTIRIYRALAVRYADWCTTNGTDPARVDPLDVRNWSNTLTGSRSILAQARGAIKHLASLYERPGEPWQTIRLPARGDDGCRALTDLDLHRLVRAAEALEGNHRLVVMVGLYTAARRSEIASLAWDRIDFDTGDLTLWRPKNRDFHTIPLHPHLAELLEPRRAGGERWVFPGRWGGHVHPGTINAWIGKVAAVAGVACTPHQLRHTALAVANDETGDLRAVQQFAGHRDPAVTARYTRATRQRLDAAVGSLNFARGA